MKNDVYRVSFLSVDMPNCGSWLPLSVVKDHYISGHDIGIWKIKNLK